MRGRARSRARPSPGAATRSGWSRCASSSTPVDQPRARARERGRGVDGDDALGAERFERVADRSPARAPRRRTRPHGIDDDHVRARRGDLLPGDGPRAASPAPPSDVGAAGQRRSSPAPSGRRRTAGRATRGRPRAGRGAPATASPRRARSGARARPAAAASSGDPGGVAERDDVVEHVRERLGSSEITSRAARQPSGDRPHVVVGDGAHRAHRLGDDQVDVEARERRLVELVERPALAGQRPRPRRRSRRGRGRRG